MCLSLRWQSALHLRYYSASMETTPPVFDLASQKIRKRRPQGVRSSDLRFQYVGCWSVSDYVLSIVLATHYGNKALQNINNNAIQYKENGKNWSQVKGLWTGLAKHKTFIKWIPILLWTDFGIVNSILFTWNNVL